MSYAFLNFLRERGESNSGMNENKKEDTAVRQYLPKYKRVLYAIVYLAGGLSKTK